VIRQSFFRVILQLFLATSASLACLSPAAAQSASSDSSLAQTLVHARKSNWMLYAETSSGAELKGRVRSIDSVAVRIGSGTVSLDSIMKVEHARRVGGAAKPVAILFGAFGGYMMGALEAGLCEYNCSLRDVILVGSIGAGFAGAIGLLVGRLFEPGRIETSQVWP
jgi:hypothetical protein